MLHDKTQVFSAIKQFFHIVHTQFETKILMVRIDNGSKFIQTTCLDFFLSHGILHQKSIVKTPQQNGVVERKHRHLLDTARAIRFHAGLPKSFWSECVLSATHIINRLPMSNLSWKSPFELFYHQSPDYSTLRTIGCLSFAANVGEQDKFEARAHKCVLLGYSFGYKGYKLFDLHTKKIFHSRDVLFQESIFPFKNSTVISSAHPKLPFAEPLFPHLAPPLAPDSPHDFPSSPLSSHDIPSPANDSTDYHSSPSSHTISPTPVDHTDCDIHVSSTPVRTEPYTRKIHQA